MSYYAIEKKRFEQLIAAEYGYKLLRNALMLEFDSCISKVEHLEKLLDMLPNLEVDDCGT